MLIIYAEMKKYALWEKRVWELDFMTSSFMLVLPTIMIVIIQVIIMLLQNRLSRSMKIIEAWYWEIYVWILLNLKKMRLMYAYS